MILIKINWWLHKCVLGDPENHLLRTCGFRLLHSFPYKTNDNWTPTEVSKFLTKFAMSHIPSPSARKPVEKLDNACQRLTLKFGHNQKHKCQTFWKNSPLQFVPYQSCGRPMTPWSSRQGVCLLDVKLRFEIWKNIYSATSCRQIFGKNSRGQKCHEVYKKKKIDHSVGRTVGLNTRVMKINVYKWCEKPGKGSNNQLFFYRLITNIFMVQSQGLILWKFLPILSTMNKT